MASSWRDKHCNANTHAPVCTLNPHVHLPSTPQVLREAEQVVGEQLEGLTVEARDGAVVVLERKMHAALVGEGCLAACARGNTQVVIHRW